MSDRREDSLQEGQPAAHMTSSFARAMAHGGSGPPPQRSALEIAETIRALHEVHQQGGLTVEEFAKAKQQVLESRPPTTNTSTERSRSKAASGERRRGRHRRRGAGPAQVGSGGSGSTKHSTRRSSSSSSSSSSDGSRFIVVPRTSVWRALQSNVPDGAGPHTPTADEELQSPLVQSPLHRTRTATRAVVAAARFGDRRRRPSAGAPAASPAAGASDTEETALLVRDDEEPCGAAAARGDDADEDADLRYAHFPLGPLAAEAEAEGEGEGSPAAGASVAYTGAVPLSRGDERRTTFASDTGRSLAGLRPQPSSTGSEAQRHWAAYGTFFQSMSAVVGAPAESPREAEDASGGYGRPRARLEPDHEVRVRYFNSRGRSGDRFSEVRLREEELRDPVYLHKGVASVDEGDFSDAYAFAAAGAHALGRRGRAKSYSSAELGRLLVVAPMEGSGSQAGAPDGIAPMTAEERKAWAAMSSSGSSRSSKGSSSYLEQSLNWYWIDVTGRDPSRRRYNSALRILTKRFNICESFLVDREHVLMLSQIVESPNHPGQYLLNLRVATQKIAISDDSVIELTNRWIIIVDLRQHFVMTLHRIDTQSMAELRAQWKAIMGSNDVPFQEFLLKIINDALQTYELSLDVHADLLDRCETKLFANEGKVFNDGRDRKNESSRPSKPGEAENFVNLRILYHFAGSSRSTFLRRLLDANDRRALNKMEMNSFLHHLHRRTSVQHRMLNATQTVLQKAFTKLQLCSREMADQMCGNCMELSGRALEVRDDAKTLLDLHISLQSFRTSELMAVLTRVSLFFTPCTFIAGVYGMNFRHMPELDWYWGYPAFWGVCLLLVLMMQQFVFRG